jgi:hypothetical protein
MASRGRKKAGRFASWWESKSDSHFQIITYVTIISVALLLWGLIFFILLSGASDPTKSNLLPLTWLGLFFGAIGAFYVLPEFFVYLGERQILEDILALDSRAEIIRRRKEGEDAAIMLGKPFMARFRGLLELHEISVGKKLGTESRAPNRSSEGSDSMTTNVWWNNSNSILAVKLPGLKALDNINFHRSTIITSAGIVGFLIYNSISGLAVSATGVRDHTIDLTAKLGGEGSFHEIAPHFDAVSMLLIGFFGIILYSTKPAFSGEEEE